MMCSHHHIMQKSGSHPHSWKLMKGIIKGAWRLLESILHLIVFRIFRLKLSEETWKGFLQFVKIGLSNTLISYGIYVITLFSCRALSVLPKTDYILGQVLGFFISVLWSFFWNRRYVFRPEEGEQISVGRALLKTYMSYAFTGLILSPGLTILWVEALHISKLLAPIISLVVTVPLNFVLNKFWAFRTHKKG